MRIRQGDKVIMLGGKNRGKDGKVLRVLPASPAGGPAASRVVVEGLNLIKRHQRARREGQKGQIVSKERTVAASAVQLVCPHCGRPTRVGYKIEGDLKTRVCKKCGATL